MPVYRAIGVSMDYPRASDGDPTGHAGARAMERSPVLSDEIELKA